MPRQSGIFRCSPIPDIFDLLNHAELTIIEFVDDKQWFLYVVDHHEGPFTIDEVRQRIKEGQAKPSSYVWKEGMADWVMMNEVAEFGDSGPGKDSRGPFSFAVNEPKLEERQIPEEPARVEVKASKKGTAGNLGYSGVSSRRSRWYTSTKFWLFALLVTGAVVYQLTALSKLDSVYEKMGIKDKVVALHLEPIHVEKAEVESFLQTAKTTVMPLIEVILPKVKGYLPAPLVALLSPIQLPEEVPQNDREALSSVMKSDLSNGARFATALAVGEELNPTFFIASNLPNGANLTVLLQGRKGTLINALGYEKKVFVEVQNHIARTSRFMWEGTKPLPKGEYLLIIYEADAQNPIVTQSLQGLQKRTPPSYIPKEKVAFSTDTYFLGGKKDEDYLARVQEFNQRIQSRMGQELAELRQISVTLESMANESAVKFFNLAKPPIDKKKKAQWQKYHGTYSTLSEQVKTALSKLTPELLRQEYALPELYNKLKDVFVLTESLHQAEDVYMLTGGNMDEVRKKARSTVDALTLLKHEISKIDENGAKH